MQNLLCADAALINGDPSTAIEIYAMNAESTTQTTKRTRKNHNFASRGFDTTLFSQTNMITSKQQTAVTEDSLTDFFKHYGY